MSCVFCKKIEDNDSVIRNGLRVLSFEPLFPVTPGHRLFVSRLHVDDAAVDPDITGWVFAAAARYAATQKEDFNLIVNSGLDATQSIRHLHVHYIPRRPDDDLKLPWTDQKRNYELKA